MEEMNCASYLDAEIEAFNDTVDEAAGELLANVLAEFVQFANGVIYEHYCDADEIAQEHFDKINAELHYVEQQLCQAVTGRVEQSTPENHGLFSERFQIALDEAIADAADFPFFTFRLDGQLKISIEGE